MTIAHCVCGIDPGQTGGIAFFFPDAPERVSVIDMPMAGGEVSATILADHVRRFAPTLVVIEEVASRPGQGVASMFKFGRSCGIAAGVIGALGIPVRYVRPQTWKKHFRLGPDKELSRREALRLFPAVSEHFSLKRHEGRAEAALLARFGADTLLRRDAA